MERLWRTVNYEEVYLKACANATEARRELGEYFRFYNNRRPHQALGCRMPAEVFYGEPVVEELKERRCSDQSVLLSSERVQESHLIAAYSCPTNGVHLTPQSPKKVIQMGEDRRTVKAYVESITDDPHSQEARLLVTFRLEWPSRAISPSYRVSVNSSYEDAVRVAWPSIVSFFDEIREPNQIVLERTEPRMDGT